MTRKQIERFIYRIMKSEKCENDFHIVFTFYPDYKMYGVIAFVNVLKKSKSSSIADGVLLFLNRKVFTSKRNIAYQKSCILHELGHVFTYSCRDSRREYRAQMLAYNKAKELGLKKVCNEILKITNDWKCYSKSSRYYKAFLIAKNQKII